MEGLIVFCFVMFILQFGFFSLSINRMKQEVTRLNAKMDELISSLTALARQSSSNPPA